MRPSTFGATLMGLALISTASLADSVRLPAADISEHGQTAPASGEGAYLPDLGSAQGHAVAKLHGSGRSSTIKTWDWIEGNIHSRAHDGGAYERGLQTWAPADKTYHLTWGGLKRAFRNIPYINVYVNDVRVARINTNVGVRYADNHGTISFSAVKGDKVEIYLDNPNVVNDYCDDSGTYSIDLYVTSSFSGHVHSYYYGPSFNADGGSDCY